MTEKWKKIDNNYQISNKGQIKNKYNRILKQCKNKNGYLYIMLYFDGKRKNLLVHRLVATCFINEIKEKMTVNHIDGNKHNNFLENLEIISQSENQKHFHQFLKNKPNKNCKPIIRNDGKKYKNCYEAARDIKSNVSSVRSVLKGRNKSCKGFLFKYEI